MKIARDRGVTAFAAVCSEPWMITEASLEQIIAIAQGVNDTADFEALQAARGDSLPRSHSVRIRGEHENVAVIPINGPIFRHANLFTRMSGATSTDLLAQDLRTALADSSIDAIALEVNSPGGQVPGIHELANMIHDARRTKPVIAYAGGTMASAAYWLGAGAEEIVADRTAVVGSIGVILTVTDSKVREERSGVRTYTIVSSNSPDKVLDPSVDAGRAKLQRIVDDMHDVFVDSVARFRGVSTDKVHADYGQGGTMLADQALHAGVIDRIGSLEQVIEQLSANGRERTRSFFMRGPITVSDTNSLRAAMKAGHSADEITLQLPDVDKIKAEAKAEGITEEKTRSATAIAAARDEGRAAGVTDERARVVALNKVTVKGFEATVAEAIASGATAEATALQIVTKQKDTGTTLQQQQREASAAAPPAGDPAAGDPGKDGGAVAGESKHRSGWKAAVASLPGMKSRKRG